jgi:hypothetical protein
MSASRSGYSELHAADKLDRLLSLLVPLTGSAGAEDILPTTQLLTAAI